MSYHKPLLLSDIKQFNLCSTTLSCMDSTFDRLCLLVVRVPGYTTEMYCVSCEVRTEFTHTHTHTRARAHTHTHTHTHTDRASLQTAAVQGLYTTCRCKLHHRVMQMARSIDRALCYVKNRLVTSLDSDRSAFPTSRFKTVRDFNFMTKKR
jgi:hypothetical protein